MEGKPRETAYHRNAYLNVCLTEMVSALHSYLPLRLLSSILVLEAERSSSANCKLSAVVMVWCMHVWRPGRDSTVGGGRGGGQKTEKRAEKGKKIEGGKRNPHLLLFALSPNRRSTQPYC